MEYQTTEEQEVYLTSKHCQCCVTQFIKQTENAEICKYPCYQYCTKWFTHQAEIHKKTLSLQITTVNNTPNKKSFKNKPSEQVSTVSTVANGSHN